MQQMAHPDGEKATARAAAAIGTLMCLSSWSTVCLEEVAAAAPDGPKWFQLYVYKDREVTLDLIKRAEAAGYTALAVTVDTPVRLCKSTWKQLPLALISFSIAVPQRSSAHFLRADFHLLVLLQYCACCVLPSAPAPSGALLRLAPAHASVPCSDSCACGCLCGYPCADALCCVCACCARAFVAGAGAARSGPAEPV